MTDSDKIATALVAAQAQFRAVAKRGHNKYDKYHYATLEDYVRATSPVLTKHGLAVVSSVDEVIPSEPRSTAGGQPSYHVFVRMTLRIMHESGQSITVQGVGEGQDRADKAVYKAITGCRKYLLASAFGLATTDDPEYDGPTQKRANSSGNSRSASEGASSGPFVVCVTQSEPIDQACKKIAGLSDADLRKQFAHMCGHPDFQADLKWWYAVCKAVSDRAQAVCKVGTPEFTAIASLLKKHAPKKD